MKKGDILYFDFLNINNLVATHIEIEKNNGNGKKINELTLRFKYTYLIHLIITRYKSNEYGAISLNSAILQNILGVSYTTMLSTLEENKVIYVGKQYNIGESCRNISLLKPYNDLIKVESNTNKQKVLNYIDKSNRLLANINQTIRDNDIERITESAPEIQDLIKTYDKNLKLLKVIDKKEFFNYLKERPYISSTQKNYYQRIYDEYLQNNKLFQIKSLDKNYRIYSILTSTPRYIKNFLNIKYSIDIHNSHPLLFNYFIIKDYNLDSNILNIIYQYISKLEINNQLNNIDNIIYHFINNDCNGLNISNKEKSKITDIPRDIWLYIAETSTGHFWDNFTDSFMEFGLTRLDVKATLFQEVFYSKKSTWKGKQFAKAFRKRYPSVWQLIKRMKNEIKEKNRNAIREAKTMVDKKKAEKETENNNIANVMMKLESDIFQKILMRLYKKRNCHVLSIHDAIVMLDTKSSNKYTDEDVRKVILQVYKRYNLSPSLSVDTFNPTKWHEEIKIQKDNQPQIDKKITELRELAKQNDEKAQEILLLIDKGEVEIILNENKKLFFHRLFANNLNDKTIKGKYKAIQIANYEYA